MISEETEDETHLKKKKCKKNAIIDWLLECSLNVVFKESNIAVGL